jgi:hypothetical protein
MFFLELRLESPYKHSNFLSKEDQQLWLDAVLLPALDALSQGGSWDQPYPRAVVGISPIPGR